MQIGRSGCFHLKPMGRSSSSEEGGLCAGTSKTMQYLTKLHMYLVRTKDLSLGIFRSDYMVHKDPSNLDAKAVIKQVEFNTIASSFGGLSTKVSALHKYVSAHLLLSAMLMITLVTFSPFPPTHLPLHHSYRVTLSHPIHLSHQYLAVSPLPIKHIAAPRSMLNCRFAPSSLFRIPKTMHLINTLWLPIFSQTTTSSPSASLSLRYCPIRLYHLTRHPDP